MKPDVIHVPMSAVRHVAVLAALTFATPSSAQSQGQVTPSRVYQAAQDLIAEIEVLRDEMGIVDYPPEAEPQEDRAPVHVYAKSLEVATKVSRAQRRLGMPAGPAGQIPVKEIVPKDVLASVRAITREVRRIKDQPVIETKITPTPFAGGKTPSSVYQSLGNASFLLDGLVGRPMSPS